ncbi:Inner membrane protein [Lysobacter dokdonensis DS-58]|uniref:Inner membrane protein n=1 Tax=Lysobacter dokdonensis DS-58 TaxID=1300345 RepID=A0A0A2WNV7_9GAMM|nr:hypothetical protein [Lysobacter dokdonensis]KGQ20427.1 Inner membrane protein [Lysobacter dokdonensis DS-58]
MIDGACHCGNLRIALDWPADAARIPARACGCTFCRKHGAVWTSHPAAALAVRIEDPARVARYAFGTRTADFLVCAGCGVVVAATCDIDGRTYAVVNINTFEGVDAARFDRSDSDVEGETVDARLARRRSRWIADVRFD